MEDSIEIAHILEGGALIQTSPVYNPPPCARRSLRQGGGGILGLGSCSRPGQGLSSAARPGWAWPRRAQLSLPKCFIFLRIFKVLGPQNPKILRRASRAGNASFSLCFKLFEPQNPKFFRRASRAANIDFPKGFKGFRAIVWCVVSTGQLRPGSVPAGLGWAGPGVFFI